MGNYSKKAKLLMKMNPAAKEGYMGRVLEKRKMKLYSTPSAFKANLATKPQ